MLSAQNFLDFAIYLLTLTSMFWLSKDTQFVKGYATVRKDHSNILGGGLLLFIRTDIAFEKLYSFEKVVMEIISVRLKTTKSTWLVSTSYYYSAKLL